MLLCQNEIIEKWTYCFQYFGWKKGGILEKSSGPPPCDKRKLKNRTCGLEGICGWANTEVKIKVYSNILCLRSNVLQIEGK